MIISGASLHERRDEKRQFVSTLHMEKNSEQLKALERLADYPQRVERLRRLWIDCAEEGDRMPRPVSQASCTGRSSRAGVSRGANVRIPAGPLTAGQIRQLMNRDITPEDYELLLLLDEGVVKKAKTLSPDTAALLPRATGSAWVDTECGICLVAMEEDEDVRLLPGCGHFFHAPCAQRWLTSEKATCPLCGQEEYRQEKVIKVFRIFDENHDGLIELSEMKKVMSSLDADFWNSDRVERLFEHADVNQDGKIDTEEFVNWLFAISDGGKLERTLTRQVMLERLEAS